MDEGAVSSPQHSDTGLRIGAERLDLLFQQSSRAAYMGMIMALLLAVILWEYSNQLVIAGWVVMVFITGVSRLALYIQYNRRGPEPEAVPRWESAYLATLIMYFLVWGVGGVFILPADNMLYVVVVFSFLLGMSGAAVSVFSANRTALVSAIFLLLSPISLWLYARQEPLALGIALASTAFLLSAIYASRVQSDSMLENLQRKYELIRSKNDADELAGALSRALDDTTEASNAKTRFLASASHDLRQPIHSLSLLGAALGLRPLDDRSREIAAGINQSIETLSQQLDALLDISKLDAGVVPIEMVDLDLYVLLDNLCSEMAVMAVRSGIDVQLSCPQPCPVHCDPTQLERILRNLVTNAIRHNRECQVLLQAELVEDACELVVEDTGKGIPIEEQDKVFEEFYQVENPSRDKGKGLGLGLAIIRRLQAMLGLEMRFVSSPGHGTRFSFTLQPAEPLRGDEPQAGIRTTVAAGLQVLVVDDDAPVRDSMRHLLEELQCDAIITASTADALATVTDRRPDVALVDYRLGGGETGLDTIVALRGLYPDLPAYLVTGDVTAEQFQAAGELGVEILNKPLGLPEIEGLLVQVEASA